MSAPLYTLDELRSALRKSSLITIVTEGRDDYSLLRSMQNKIGAGDCLPAGGKSNVLSLHAERHTLSCPKMSFLVDCDLWLFSGIPNALASSESLVITDGYSIENDVMRDYNPEILLYDDEIDCYRSDLLAIIRWYAAGVTARIQGQEFSFKRPISKLIDDKNGELTTEAKMDVALWNPSTGLIDSISSDYKRLLRGKTWLSLLRKYLCGHKRVIQHQPTALLEVGMRSGGPLTEGLLRRLSAPLR